MEILIEACSSSSPGFLMMYSAYKLNMQGDNIQPWCTPFPIWNQSCSMSSSNCCFLTWLQIYQEAGQVVWYSHLFQNFPLFIVIHTVKGFGIVSKAEVNVFLELSCFFYDPTDVDNLISGSYAFSKTSWNIWKFLVHVLLKPGLENFEHYYASMWNEYNCAVVWAFFGIAFLWDKFGMKTDLFQSCGHWWVFKFAGILSAALSQHHLSFWNNSARIPSPQLA